MVRLDWGLGIRTASLCCQRALWAWSEPACCRPCLPQLHGSDLHWPSTPTPAEGAVFYSDQQFISAGAAEDSPQLTNQQALTKFGEFIRTFQVNNKSSSFPYA